jgi:hypothetical protein
VAIGDWRYRSRVPKEIQQQAAAGQLGDPEWFSPALEAPAQYPESARIFLVAATKRLAQKAPDKLEPGALEAIDQLESEQAADPKASPKNQAS